MATRKSAPKKTAKAKTPAVKPAPAKKVKSGPKTLTKRVALFVTEYLVDFNGTKAAIRAGYSAPTAAQAASRMLRMPVVKAALKAGKAQAKVEEHAEAINRMELTVERVKLEIARLAYFDPRKMADKDGNPIPLHELDDDTAACINGLDVLEEFEGSGEDRRFVGYVKKYKIADKNAALEKASKILGLFEKDNAQQAKPLAEALGQFFGQLHDSGAAKLKPVPPAQRPKDPAP